MLQHSVCTWRGRTRRLAAPGTLQKEKLPMNPRLAPFLVFSAAVTVGCSQPGSPTSPTSIASSIQVAGTPGAATFSADARSAASTTTVPFKGSLEGTYTGSGEPPLVSVHVEAQGNATHLGRFTFDSPHVVNFADFTGAGTAELTAANGDQVTTDVTGVAMPQDTPGVFLIIETHIVTGGTGRFAGATGRFVVERVSFPSGPTNGTTSGSIEGTLSLTRGSR
jgi:hypothetical protein